MGEKFGKQAENTAIKIASSGNILNFKTFALRWAGRREKPRGAF